MGHTSAKIGLTLVVGLSWIASSQAALRHRWSFDADASDSVGGAHGALMFDAAVSGGQVHLDGADDFVDLPAGTIAINTYGSLTLELWHTQPELDQGFSMTACFGDTWGNGFGRDYLMVSTTRGNQVSRAAIANTPDQEAPWEDEVGVDGPELNDGLEHYYVMTVTGETLSYYIDGELQGTTALSGTSIAGLANSLAYLGKGVYSVDPQAQVSVNEYRIHDVALGDLSLAVNAFLGPDDASGDVGAVTSSALVGQDQVVVDGAKQLYLEVAFEQLPGPIQVRQETGLVWASDNEAVLTVSQTGVITGIAPGTATVSAALPDLVSPVTRTIGVIDRALKHRYSFNGPNDFNEFGFPEEDVVGDADAVLYGERSNGNAVLESIWYSYLDMPNDIISPLGSATFEIWVTPEDVGDGWQRIWDFGITDLGEIDEFTLEGYFGAEFLFLTARRGAAASLSTEFSGGRAQVLGPGYTFGDEQHVVVVYNTGADTSTLYVNGLEVGSATGTPLLDGLDDVNNWLGRSQYWEDGWLNASIDEFRIYSGVLSPQEVAVSYGGGPDGVPLQDPGALAGLALTADTTFLVVEAVGAQTVALADFTNVDGVPVNGFEGVTYESSDPSVLTVSAEGYVEAVGPGTANAIVQFGGESANLAFSVDAISKPTTLLHHWDFNEDPGTTQVMDPVGGAHGDIITSNSYTFTGTSLQMPGGGTAEDPTGGYVDLPNGVISALPGAATFEVWYTWEGSGSWQRIFDFGQSDTLVEGLPATGAEYIFLTANSGNGFPRVAVASAAPGYNNEFPSLETGIPSPANERTHIVFTYDTDDGISRLYFNGTLVANDGASFPLASIPDLNVWLGRAQYAGDPIFQGQWHDLRIYSGIMSGNDVATSYLAGPPGDLPPVGPVLEVEQAGADLILKWTDTQGVYGVEDAGTLAPGVGAGWDDAGLTPAEVEGKQQVTLPILEDEAYFRLSN